MTFGEMIRAAREKQGLSYREVAHRAGVSKTTLLYIESGATQDPRLSLVVALLYALKLHVRDLRQVTEWPKPRSQRQAAVEGEDAAPTPPSS